MRSSSSRDETGETGLVERLDTLGEVRGALRRELYVLAEHPALVWRQLHNRLQWADRPLADLLAAERERRSRLGARAWVHRYTPLRESDALIRTLTGHTTSVEGCAVSPDGTFIVSASWDKTLKVWDVATGTVAPPTPDC
jgi:hypothetical protein